MLQLKMLLIQKLIQKIRRFFYNPDLKKCLDILDSDSDIVSLLYFDRLVGLGTESIKLYSIKKRNICHISLEIQLNNNQDKYLSQFIIDSECYDRLLTLLNKDNLLHLNSYTADVTDGANHTIIFISENDLKYITIYQPELNTSHWRLTNMLEEFVRELREKNIKSSFVKIRPDTWWEWFTGIR